MLGAPWDGGPLNHQPHIHLISRGYLLGISSFKNKESLILLGGGFKDCLFSPRFFWEMIQFDEHIFFKSNGWFNHQLVAVCG